MNFFLVIYDRNSHRLVSMGEFGEDYDAAARSRAEAELRGVAAGNTNMEIVLLGAESLDVLNRTHSRYFIEGRELINRVQEAIERAA